MRTILPSSVAGSCAPVWVRIPSHTSWVRFSRSRDAQRLLVVPEAHAEAGRQAVVERLLAGVAERRVPGVVAEADRLDEILVQAQRARDDARDRGRLERVRHAGAVVVALGVDEYLCLSLQPPERLRVHEPVAVSLERRAHRTRLLRALPPAGLVGANGQRGQRELFERAHPLLERLCREACDFHRLSVVAAPDRSAPPGYPASRANGAVEPGPARGHRRDRITARGPRGVLWRQ